MDENKIYDLLEKIYIEVQTPGQRLDKVDSRLDSIKNDVKKIDMKVL